jgi:serine/threonine protein phosphatase PrpC
VRQDPSVHVAWSVGGASARGATHVRKGQENQDAIAWAPSSGAGDTAVIAVSDGHGSETHFRSAVGARFAVETALAELGDFVAKFKDTGLSATNSAALGIPGCIHKAWQQRVDTDLLQSPTKEKIADPNDRFIPYGATLVAVAVAPTFILLLQLGDGDILVGFSDGQIKRLLVSDIGLAGEQTNSLCDPNAVKLDLFRLQVVPILGATARPDFIMLSTDGLSKSCADEQGFVKLAREWRTVIQRDSLKTITGSLEPWLAQASRNGSGDDVTLAFAAAHRPAGVGLMQRATTVAGSNAGPLPNIELLQRRIASLTHLIYGSLAVIVVLMLIVAGMLWWMTRPAVQPPVRKPAPWHRHQVAPAPQAPDGGAAQSPKPRDDGDEDPSPPKGPPRDQ